ncbi:MAG: sn-glycerol-1-phosphate dehydrogenase [Ruminococcaceae bacterium]|nr:sn-glycerol-1-phosphate dehydrogenase [Oscillospiraceae bacterium]
MDINQLLQGLDCPCGRPHTCPIQYVYIEPNAAARLGEICGHRDRVLLVADENTYAAAGRQVAEALQGKSVRQVLFPGAPLLIPNEDAIDTVTAALGDAELIVGVGSGVIQDLCKYVSHQSHVPYVIVATAPSMDGYASSGAAMITGGMKVTYPVGLPTAILADPAVLAQAPLEMLKAGYGDIIGKYSSLNDWKLSHLVNGEYFCQQIYDLTFEQVQNTIRLADGILKRDEAAMAALMEALVVVGILLSFVGNSRPASGSEHHLSHFFEITGIINGRDYFPHGIDVAYSTIITAQLRERLLQAEFPARLYRPDPARYRTDMERIYKQVAPGCMALQEEMGRYQSSDAAPYLDHESAIRSVLAEMPSADEIVRLLGLVELDPAEFYAFYGDELLADAIHYAKDLKDRYTVLWMYYDFFGTV